MPIYEYVCQDCDKRYEKFIRSITAKVEPICPVCGSRHSEKVVSAFGSVRGSLNSSGDSLIQSSGSDCGPVG